MARKSKGALKALKNMQDRYGVEQGKRVYFATATKKASPSVAKLNPNARASKVFATGNQQKPGKGGLKKRAK
jgi:hypothetical protein